MPKTKNPEKNTRTANVYNHAIYAGKLIDYQNGSFAFEYDEAYRGPPISLTMPLTQRQYTFAGFPAFFDGLLPEGMMLEALLKQAKIDRDDYFTQLITVGQDMVGSVTVRGSGDSI